MDEVEIQPVEAEAVHRRVEGAQRRVEAVVVVPHLRGDEEILPVRALDESLAHLADTNREAVEV